MSKKKKKGSLLIYIEYLATLCLIRIISLMTYRMASDTGGFIGLLIYLLDSRHRHISHQNLRMAFPEMDHKRLVSIARGAFKNLGRSAAEILFLATCKKDVFYNIFDKWVQINNKDRIEQLFLSQNGKLFLTAHFGNWELLGISVSSSGGNLSVIARPMDNPRIDRILTSFRTIAGTRVIPKKGAIKEILRRLKGGESVGILIDQNTSRAEGVFVDFFGRSAATNRGPALIALKSNVQVIPVFIVREGRYRHKVQYFPEIILERTNDIEKDVQVNTDRFTRVVESIIRQYPEQWLWMHQRWKTRP